MTYILSDSQGVNIENSLKIIKLSNDSTLITKLIITGDIIYSPTKYGNINNEYSYEDETFETYQCSNLYNIYYCTNNHNIFEHNITTILGRSDLNKLKIYKYLEMETTVYDRSINELCSKFNMGNIDMTKKTLEEFPNKIKWKYSLLELCNFLPINQQESYKVSILGYEKESTFITRFKNIFVAMLGSCHLLYSIPFELDYNENGISKLNLMNQESLLNYLTIGNQNVQSINMYSENIQKMSIKKERVLDDDDIYGIPNSKENDEYGDQTDNESEQPSNTMSYSRRKTSHEYDHQAFIVLAIFRSLLNNDNIKQTSSFDISINSSFCIGWLNKLYTQPSTNIIYLYDKYLLSYSGITNECIDFFNDSSSITSFPDDIIKSNDYTYKSSSLNRSLTTTTIDKCNTFFRQLVINSYTNDKHLKAISYMITESILEPGTYDPTRHIFSPIGPIEKENDIDNIYFNNGDTGIIQIFKSVWYQNIKRQDYNARNTIPRPINQFKIKNNNKNMIVYLSTSVLFPPYIDSHGIFSFAQIFNFLYTDNDSISSVNIGRRSIAKTKYTITNIISSEQKSNKPKEKDILDEYNSTIYKPMHVSHKNVKRIYTLENVQLTNVQLTNVQLTQDKKSTNNSVHFDTTKLLDYIKDLLQQITNLKEYVTTMNSDDSLQHAVVSYKNKYLKYKSKYLELI